MLRRALLLLLGFAQAGLLAADTTAPDGVTAWRETAATGKVNDMTTPASTRDKEYVTPSANTPGLYKRNWQTWHYATTTAEPRQYSATTRSPTATNSLQYSTGMARQYSTAVPTWQYGTTTMPPWQYKTNMPPYVFQKAFPNMVKMPTFPPRKLTAAIRMDNSEAMSAMLWSWYMSGFYTGYYQALQQSANSNSIYK